MLQEGKGSQAPNYSLRFLMVFHAPRTMWLASCRTSFDRVGFPRWSFKDHWRQCMAVSHSTARPSQARTETGRAREICDSV